MELHQLRYFVAVAELGSFTRASEKCFVAQPSLSQQIIKLERELGQPLFDRTLRQAKLTDAGRILYERAVSILAAVDDAKRRVSDTLECQQQGQVVLGAIPTIAPYLLPSLLKTFQRQFSQAQVIIQENFTAEILRGLREGELDVGIMALPVADPHLASEALFSEELLLALPSDHPLATKRRVTLDDLAALPFILLSETHCLGEQIMQFCKQQSHLPFVSCRSAQLLTVQELVALGHGISLVPQMAADLDRSKRRKYRSLHGSKPTRTIGIVWHKQRYHSPMMKRLMETMRSKGIGDRG